MVSGEKEFQSPLSLLQDRTTYVGLGILPKAPPPPKDAPSKGHETYGRDNTNSPPSPRVAPSRGQTTFSQDNPNSNSQITFLEELEENSMDDPRTPPNAPTPPRPFDPTRIIFRVSICIEGGNACTELS